jgi:hypothetical protein
MAVANNLAYFYKAAFIVVKNFYNTGPWSQCYKFLIFVTDEEAKNKLTCLFPTAFPPWSKICEFYTLFC